ncbi:glycosyltransferase [Mesobacillus foraminis]|uniref:glycosyltransferase n=1 Tax=Mesobacillus foraminis TaxID=279826 RepID=UPI000EF46B85|nr:glycosyltransferase [Mesobacillus foraminis]
MKKILFFIESLAGGGAEKVLVDLVKNIDKNKFDITVATVVDIGVYTDEIKKHCNYFSFLSTPNKCGNFIISNLIYKIKYKLIYKLPIFFIYKYFIREKYDIEVGFIEGFATKVISKSPNSFSRKISWVHVDPINRDYADEYYKNLESQIKSYKRYEKVICVSNSVKEAFKKKFYESNDNILVRYNPVDSANIIAKSKEECEIKRTNKMLIGSIGRLTNQKGYDRLLKVVKKLKNEGLDFELWILGEGTDRSSLEKYIRENQLENTVKLLGFQKNPYKFIKQCDLFVCSSRAEGFSLAIAESMVLGLPIISTDCAGPNELLDFGNYGMVVENNEDSLYLGLKQLMINKPLLLQYVNKSLQRKEIFNIETAIQEIEKLLI